MLLELVICALGHAALAREGTTTYDYDGLINRLTSAWPSTGQVVYYGYDAASNLTSISDNSGTVDYTYNSLNWFASELSPHIRVLITQHLRGFRHDQQEVVDDRAGTFSR